jgi:hypothetical protein
LSCPNHDRHTPLIPVAGDQARMNQSQPVPVLLSTFQLSRCFSSPGKRIALLLGHGFRYLRYLCRFRSVPLTAVVSHILGDLSRGLPLSFPNSLQPLVAPHRSSDSHSSDTASNTRIPLVFALLRRREVVSHNSRGLSRGVAAFFSRCLKRVFPFSSRSPLACDPNTQKKA